MAAGRRARRRVARARSTRADPPPRAAVVETPLLFEAGLEGVYDATIAVVADEDVRAERAAARGHHAVDERAARQLSQEEKAARATYVVANSGTVEQLELALAAVLEKLTPPPTRSRMSTHPRQPPAAARARPRAGPPRAGAPCCAAGSRPARAPRCWWRWRSCSRWPQFHHAVREITLPLRHEDIIRQQAHDKGLDPALIAAVIYAESHFRDGQTSAAGAAGPHADHAGDRARTSRTSRAARSSCVDDLGTPQVNIAYGAYYLRYLLRRYDGNVDVRARGLQRRRGQRRPLDRRGARRTTAP